jgi:hypothetical protein
MLLESMLLIALVGLACWLIGRPLFFFLRAKRLDRVVGLMCAEHEFEAVDPQKKLGGKWRCKHCSGEVDAVAKYWYNLGLKHGAR